MAIAKNNYLVSSHFRKYWQRHIRTWFHQPSQKLSRRYQRNVRLTKEAPRPVGMLRPEVHTPSLRHNMKSRSGRGFSIEELKRAGVSKKIAPTIGIAVDLRRRNRSEEALNTNSERLKSYMSRLVLFPRAAKLRKGFGGLPNDTSRNMAQEYMNEPIAKVVPISQKDTTVQARAITDADRNFNAFLELKKLRNDQRKTYRKTRREALRKKMFDNRETRRARKAMG
eukprot:Lankesteria_metandrocarpae@DN4640_c0_g1_i1.p2